MWLFLRSPADLPSLSLRYDDVATCTLDASARRGLYLASKLLAPASPLVIDVLPGPEGDPMAVGAEFDSRPDNRQYKIVGGRDETVLAAGPDDKKRDRRWSSVWSSCIAITGPVKQGTGFFISPTSVITARHVVPDAETLGRCTLLWGLFEGHEPVQLTVHDHSVRTSKRLDITIFQLAAPVDAHILSLDAAAEPVEGHSVTVYGHPEGGGQLRRSGADCRIVGVDRKTGLVHYRADTLGGVSGGPVLSNRGGKLLAVHLRQDGGESNRGRIISAIRQELDA